MDETLKDVTFEEWITHVFDHEVTENEWYWSCDSDEWDGSSELTLQYLTQLFNDSQKYLTSYSDEQIQQGFQYVISCGSDMMFSVTDDEAPYMDRLNCVRAFYPLFKGLYADKCSKHLSYCDQKGANPLNSSCYMWWDTIPLCPDENAGQITRFDQECISVMEKILSINSIACQESALHGLGHWAYAYPKYVRKIISGYLKKSKRIPDELREYADSARTGMVQ